MTIREEGEERSYKRETPLHSKKTQYHEKKATFTILKRDTLNSGRSDVSVW